MLEKERQPGIELRAMVGVLGVFFLRSHDGRRSIFQCVPWRNVMALPRPRTDRCPSTCSTSQRSKGGGVVLGDGMRRGDITLY